MHSVTGQDLWTCSGWIFGQGSTRCCAVRTRGAGQTTYGLLGLPRPDVAAAFPAEAQAFLSGFRINLNSSNRAPTQLEWMDGAGSWHQFWSETDADQTDRPAQSVPRLLPTSLLPALLAATAREITGLNWRQAWRRAAGLVDDRLSQTTPVTVGPDVLMHLDQPRGDSYAGKLFPVSGWIFSRRLPIKRLFAEVEPGGLVHLIFPKPRPDVIAVHPNLSAPTDCGFEGMILLPDKPPDWFQLRLYAVFADDSVMLATSRRFFHQPASEETAGEARARLLLGALALAGVYQPQSWLRWLQTRLPRRPRALPAPPPDHACIVAVQSSGAVPPPTQQPTEEPRETDPLISILVPVFNTPEHYLRGMIASVQVQSYARWELCLADDASTLPHVRRLLAEYARADSRIRPVYRSENGHISRASNSALAHAQGDFVALLDHDDLLAPDVLRRVVETVRGQPAAQFFYTNRDKIDDHGRHFDQEERGAWNPAMATTHNYLHHLTVIRRSLVLQAGAFRADYFGSQDLDLYLRCHELLQADQIIYVPVVGYHWRAHAASTASRGDQKDYMFDSARRGIEDALQRRGLRAKPFLPNFGPIYGMNLHQLHWDPEILRDHPVSIVVAVRPEDRHLVPSCLARLIATVPADCTQLVVVSTETPAANLPADSGVIPEFIVAQAGTPLAELYNLGAAQARNPLLLLLDAGIRPGPAGWLEDLAGWLSVPGVAAAGPKLIAADGRLASAGWTINHETQLPQPLFAGDPVGDLIAPFLAHSARDVLLLDAACVLTPTAVFRELNGYQSEDFPNRHFAADYCLRLHDVGRRMVYSPQGVLDTVRETQRDLTPAASEDTAFRVRHPRRADPWIHHAAPSDDPSASGRSESSRKSWMPTATIEFAGGWFFLEQPYPGEEIHAGHQVLSGWCLAQPGKTIAELQVRIGTQIHLAELGHPRPDLAALVGFTGSFFPVGFNLELSLPPGPARLEFSAWFTGTGWQPVCTLDLTIRPIRALTRPAPAAALALSAFDVNDLMTLPAASRKSSETTCPACLSV